MIAATSQDVARFTPSRVEGADDVTEVVVHPGRLEFITANGPRTFEFATMADAESRRVIAEMQFSRERYADSFIRFLMAPPITVYMPEDGPSRWPDSDFWHVQEVVRRGGYRIHDLAHGPRPTPDPFFDDKPILRTVVLIAVINWIVCAIVFAMIGGTALQTMPSADGFVLTQHGNRTPVSEGLWLFSLFYSAGSLCLFPGAIVAAAARMAMRRSTPQRVLYPLFVVAAGIWCWLILSSALASFRDWQSLEP